MNPSNARFVALSAVLLAACASPADDAKIDALGEEVNGVQEGEFHRPGQPCVVCHDSYGGAPEFSIAGTVFAIPAIDDKSVPRPVENATVRLTDTTGNEVTATTNCVGNFFFTPEKYDPQFPIHVVIEAELDGTMLRKTMTTDVNRERSCAGCHVGAQSQSSPGWVWAYSNAADASEDPFPEVSDACPGRANFP